MGAGGTADFRSNGPARAHREALRQSEERYRILVETAPYGISECDADGILVYCNAARREMTGHDESELVGRPVWDFAASQRARAEFKAEFSRYVAEQPSPVPRIAKYQTKDGRSIDVQMDWIYKRDGAGFVTGFVSIVTDITERTRAQGALREREERYRSLYNDTPALMHSIDRDMRVVNVSDYWLTFFGYQRSEVLGRGITDFIADMPGQTPFSEAWKDFLTQGAAHNVHRRYVNKSGEIIDVLVSATTECDEAGEVTLSRTRSCSTSPSASTPKVRCARARSASGTSTTTRQLSCTRSIARCVSSTSATTGSALWAMSGAR